MAERLYLPVGVTACLTLAIACAGDATDQARELASLPTWVVDSMPMLVLGASGDDTTQSFAQVVGATRLPSGQILVADQQEFSLHLFAATGQQIQSFGRRGDGPGELNWIGRFWRCGDSVYVYQNRNQTTAVFSLPIRYVRSFRFGRGPQASKGIPAAPYRSACNANGAFVHYGWEVPRAIPNEGMVFRRKTPFWITGADSVVRAVLDSAAGSERFLIIDAASGTLDAVGPRIFGKQTAIALGSTRAYVGTADGPEVIAIGLNDGKRDTIRIPSSPALLTAADIAAEKAIRLATVPPDRQDAEARAFDGHPFPDTLPPYAELIVDSEDLLWIQDYPRAISKSVQWRVVSADNRVIARLMLPTHLTVFEIGRDYVLGRYLDPDESIPQVRLYRLRRP